MNIGTWIVIYLPIFILLFAIIPQQRNIVAKKIKKKRVGSFMATELLKKYIGKDCTVSTGSFGSTVCGTISDIQDNWIEIMTRRGARLINADFVTNIIVNPNK